MADEEDDKPVLHRANINDEFLKHPHSGAFIRNPLREKASPNQPIIFCAGEFEHNCLEEALQDWHCVHVSESGFRDMVGSWCQSRGIAGGKASGGQSYKSLSKSGHRAALGKLRDTSFEFTVNLRKSSYIPPRNERRRPGGNKEASYRGSHIDKVNIEVSDQDAGRLRVEKIDEGLVAQWNRSHPAFVVKVGDTIVKVNGMRGTGAEMIDEMVTAHDQLRLIVRRVQNDGRSPSKDQTRRMSQMAGEMVLNSSAAAPSGGAEADGHK